MGTSRVLRERTGLRIGRAVGTVHTIFVLIVVLTLTGCQGMLLREEAALDAEPVAQEQIPAAQLVQMALRNLQSGKKKPARDQLALALQKEPSHKVAMHLLKQLETDPVQYLGEEHFNYQIAAGDSLSGIARDFLKDHLKFVILARYNDIDDPGQLRAGQLIKIPGKRRARPTDSKPQGTALVSPDSGPDPFPHEDSKVTTEGLVGDAKSGADKSSGGPSAVDSAPMNTPLSKGAGESLQPAPENNLAANKIKARRLYQQGQRLLQEQKPEQAYTLFSQAQANDPANSEISSALSQTRDKLADSYHRQALQLFRKHELDEAIGYWDKILVIDPENNLALGYRARAVELNSKLENISQ